MDWRDYATPPTGREKPKPGFLRELTERVRRIGFSLDWIELRKLLEVLHGEAGVPLPNVDPYENDEPFPSDARERSRRSWENWTSQDVAEELAPWPEAPGAPVLVHPALCEAPGCSYPASYLGAHFGGEDRCQGHRDAPPHASIYIGAADLHLLLLWSIGHQAGADGENLRAKLRDRLRLEQLRERRRNGREPIELVRDATPQGHRPSVQAWLDEPDDDEEPL